MALKTPLRCVCAPCDCAFLFVYSSFSCQSPCVALVASQHSANVSCGPFVVSSDMALCNLPLQH